MGARDADLDAGTMPCQKAAVVHVVPTLSRQAGGPAVSVRRLVQCLHAAGACLSCEVFSGDAAGSESALADWRDCGVRTFPLRGPRRLGWARGMLRTLSGVETDVIHVHGLWQYHAFAAGRVASRRDIPLVVSPRGMLEPWALRQGRWQKAIANTVFQHAMLDRAACIVTTSRMEAEGVRLAGVKAPVCVVPNGVDLPAPGLLQREGQTDGRGERTALFLSRLHPKKGLMELLEAWKSVSPTGWHLRVVGPDEAGYADVVASAIRRLGLGQQVELAGPVWGDEKQQAYAGADLFVLPSFSENFGMAIAEALAAGVPVITTRATPWGELETERCGWWIETGAAPLAEALRTACALSASELQAMGGRGRDLMARRYAWPAVAAAMLEVYSWVLGEKADAPASLFS